jgi:peptidoglycan hydrolase-like protein with peptidoglycan-binding domain
LTSTNSGVRSSHPDSISCLANIALNDDYLSCGAPPNPPLPCPDGAFNNPAAAQIEEKALRRHYLNTHGFPVVATSTYAGSLGYETQNFGVSTQAALAKFQKSVGIAPAVGYFGPVTRTYVNSH